VILICGKAGEKFLEFIVHSKRALRTQDRSFLGRRDSFEK